MRKTIGLILVGFLLSGCYASSLTYVGTGASLAQGKSIQSLGTHAASYAIQKKTGKSPLEHVLNPEQIKTYKTTKAKLNPCEQTPELCSKISLRVAFMSDILKTKIKQKNIRETK
tara:strand:+ start:757 stop:1101 length:345 start_codon:yes stop_codon:yes gene_type:complete